ncbi:MAG: ankyrin repeat domain-containing protein [Akkermansia sp.]|nr:ankyrin repeat domain-containing protein [Akkermansia sp.]MBQ7023591.1 ankyrin repeat domain-containing protein [Akkermansia sp.]
MKTPILQILIGAAWLSPFSGAADELMPWLERSNGVFSVHEAAAAGDMNALRAAAVDKLTLNMADEQGRTPLDIAAASGHVEAVRHLIACGATATEQTLRLAANAASKQVVQSALHMRNLELQLCEAVASRNVPEVRRLLAQGVSSNALTHDHQQSVLMQAAGTGRIWMLRILLENGADPNYVNAQTKSVLHVAAATGTAEIVRRLLAAGADPLVQGSNGATPLHDAVWMRNVATVQALLPAYKAQNYNPDGGRNGLPLLMAIAGGNTAVVQAFIDAGTDLRGACFEKHPPLAEAVKAGRVEISRVLYKAGADPDAKDSTGKSARDYAAGKMPHIFND